MDYVAYHRHLRERLGEMADELCGPMAGFARLHRETVKDGALPRKAKELMALAVGIALHCEGCIAFHMRDALDAGATREEILETIGVAMMMSGGPGTVYAAHALDALEQFLPDSAEEDKTLVPETECP
jgi:AhpD family alkylhydroperoxidase